MAGAEGQRPRGQPGPTSRHYQFPSLRSQVTNCMLKIKATLEALPEYLTKAQSAYRGQLPFIAELGQTLPSAFVLADYRLLLGIVSQGMGCEIESVQQQNLTFAKCKRLDRVGLYAAEKEVTQVGRFVEEQRDKSLLRFQLHQVKQCRKGLRASFCLMCKGELRFRLTVFDSQKNVKDNSCAVFIVPAGRQGSSSFASKEGRLRLLQSMGTSRLILIAKGPGTEEQPLQAVIQEVQTAVQFFLPKDVTNAPCPFLTDKEQTQPKVVVFRDETAVVEDLLTEEGVFRRLVVLDNVDQVQSQFKLKLGSRGPWSLDSQLLPEEHGLAPRIDHSYIEFEYQQIASAVLLAQSLLDQACQGLLLGAGCSALPAFLLHHRPELRMTAVDISAHVVQLAGKFFGVQESDQLRLVVQDAYQFVRHQTEGRYSFVMMDINGSLGQNSPPSKFMRPEFFNRVRALLAPGGLFIAHVIGHKTQALQQVFCPVYQAKLAEDVFQLCFCFTEQFENRSVEGKEVRVFQKYEPFLPLERSLPWSDQYRKTVRLVYPRIGKGLDRSALVMEGGRVRDRLEEQIETQRRKVRKNKRK